MPFFVQKRQQNQNTQKNPNKVPPQMDPKLTPMNSQPTHKAQQTNSLQHHHKKKASTKINIVTAFNTKMTCKTANKTHLSD